MEAHQQIFFILGLLVAVPVLVYYYRRAGHGRFRPRVGEMAMVCLFAVLLCGGGAMLVGSFLDDPDQYHVHDTLSVAPEAAGAASAEAGENQDGGGKSERRTNRDRDRGSRDDHRGTGRGGKDPRP